MKAESKKDFQFLLVYPVSVVVVGFSGLDEAERAIRLVAASGGNCSIIRLYEVAA